MKKQYTYAVARVRTREMSLLRKQDLEQLMSFENTDEAISFLKDKGWGEPDDNNLSKLIKSEMRKTWDFIEEIADQEEDFELLLCSRDYANLKTAIKSVVNNSSADNLLISHGTINGEEIYHAIKNKEFSSLPKHMKDVAEEAMKVLIHTSDGQLCDTVIDRAALERINYLGKRSKYKEVREYAEILVAASDIKIAVRGNKMGKSKDFFKSALAECDVIDIQRLVSAASKSLDDIYEYLLITKFSDAVDELKKAPSHFEKWCDNFILEKLSQSRYDSFTLMPIFYYAFLRENEIKAVRMIMLGKIGGLSEELIRERLRDMYA